MFGMRTPVKKTRGERPPTTDLTNVRKSIDKWETTTSTDRTSPTDKTPPAGPSGSTLRLTFAKPTVSRRPSSEGAESSKTYSCRSAEATACLLSARAHLKNSRNLKTEIKEAVEKALQRLSQLVREADADMKKTGSTTETKTRQSTKSMETQTDKTETTTQTQTTQTQTTEIGLQTDTTETKTTEIGVQTDTTKTCSPSETMTIVDKERETMTRSPLLGTNSFAQELREHSRLLLVTQKQMEELKVVVNNHLKTATESEAPSYARVAATGCSGRTPEKRPTLHSVVVTSKDETETSEEALDKVRKAVDAKEWWITVER